MSKKLICLIISVILVITLCACKNNPQDSSSAPNETVTPIKKPQQQKIRLLYSYSDTFNPYSAITSANRQLASLLFDPLTKIDNQFNFRPILAQSVEIEDKICTVKLRNAYFTDGTAVTSDDVIYSYNLAKNSPRYMGNFYEVVSIAAVDSKTVSIKLSQCDPYFANLLDFPIVKSGTAGVKDSDGKEITPTGCGRYKIAKDGLSFEINNNYYGKKGNINVIELINSPDAASTTHYVEIGATEMHYTDSGDIVRMSGKKTDVNLNRLVYIGINHSYGALQSKEMRYAISSAINREEICKTAYYNNAMTAKGFFNPLFEATQALQTIESKPNSKITVENLSKIGYNNLNASGFYANSSGKNPVFTLLVNSENASRVATANAIALQCKNAGIQINVISCAYEQYLERLSSGSFQLYLGEVQLLSNMDFTQLVTEGGTASYGVDAPQAEAPAPNENQDAQAQPKTSPCKAILDSYHAGQCGIGDVAGTLLTEMPQIPICYLNGVLFYDSAIQGVQASSSDVYLEFENYEF